MIHAERAIDGDSGDNSSDQHSAKTGSSAAGFHSNMDPDSGLWQESSSGSVQHLPQFDKTWLITRGIESDGVDCSGPSSSSSDAEFESTMDSDSEQDNTSQPATITRSSTKYDS